ncbi:MAG: hypothetical protein AB7T49_17175 [Oligoflexales bacterium]
MSIRNLVHRTGVVSICGLVVSYCAPAKFRAIHDREGASQNSGEVEGENSTRSGEGEVNETDGARPDKSTTLEKDFLVSGQGSSAETFALTAGGVKQEIQLQSSNQNIDIDQITRPTVQKEFHQGHDASAYTDTFTQIKGGGVIDILIVMDNSGSMSQEQANMATKMAPLLSSLTNANWKIGVVTTDPNHNCMRAVISKGDTNATSAFASAMSAGSSGSGEEYGLKMAVRGLSCTNTNWLRQGSSLAVLIVSDEDNCSDGNCPNGSFDYESSHYVGDYIKNTLNRDLGTKARMYGIIWEPTVSQSACSTGYNKGNVYAQSVAYTGGSTGSICATNYTSILNRMSSEMATTLQNQFVLKYTPNAGSVSVTVQDVGSLMPVAWTGFTVSGNVLTFTQIPPEGSTIKVSYQYGSITITKRFDLGEKPADGTLQVMVDGVGVGDTSYTLGADNVIEFGTAPAANAVVKASFKSDVPFLKEFDIGPVGIVDVKVDGVSTTDYTYDAITGKITFGTAPNEGAAITVEQGQLTYPFAAMGDNPRGFKYSLKGLGKTIPAGRIVVDASDITIDAQDFYVGEYLVIEYKNDASFQGKVELAHDPIAGTVKFDTAKAPDCASTDLTIAGKIIAWDCEVPDDAELSVSYNYKKAVLAEFTLDNPYDPNLGVWKVFVDGKEVFNYNRSNNTISFPYELIDGAKVSVQVHYEI